MKILAVNNLFVSLSKTQILRGIDLKVEQGEMVGIIGPNGSGKTTLIRTISGNLKPDSGEVLLYGKKATEFSSKELSKKVSVIPQLPQVLYPFTVEEFLIMGRFPHSGRYGYSIEKDYSVVNNIISLTGLENIKTRRMHELSGGERQRAIIAQGFIQEAGLMLLDEPTSHLDIYYQCQLLNLLAKYNKNSGTTIIIVLHDLNLAANYCDRLILLKNGTVYQQGVPKKVITNENIEAVFGTPVIVKENPVNNRPHMFLITE